jgi:hypothetical protein
MGADGKPDDAQNDDNASNNAGVNDDANKGGSGASGDAGTSKSGSDDGGDAGKSDGKDNDTISRAEYTALMNRMKAADKRATTAENRLKKIDEANLSDVEKAQQAAAEAAERVAKAEESLKNERIKNAFLAENSVTWHNSNDAFSMLNKEGLEITEDGKVTGMKEAIKSLAKDKAYLVKPTQTTEATGSEHNGRRKGDQNNDGDKSARARRFPAAYNNLSSTQS